MLARESPGYWRKRDRHGQMRYKILPPVKSHNLSPLRSIG